VCVDVWFGGQVKKAPLGVTVVAILTLLGAIGDFFFATLWIAFSGMGGPPLSGSNPPISYWIVLFNSLLLSIVALVASIGMFRGARHVWYLSMVLWAFSAVHYCYAASLIFRGETLMIIVGLAILVNVTLIVYFQSKQVRDHFLKPSNQLVCGDQAKVIKTYNTRPIGRFGWAKLYPSNNIKLYLKNK
jgi:hypothetical protein